MNYVKRLESDLSTNIHIFICDMCIKTLSKGALTFFSLETPPVPRKCLETCRRFHIKKKSVRRINKLVFLTDKLHERFLGQKTCLLFLDSNDVQKYTVIGCLLNDEV